MVEAAGFDPIEAKTADDAIDLLTMRGDIRAILTDV
jgi:hypothetical protein